ncbi:MAG: Recombinase, partial [Actinomycetia bacterium]|nr:Recombinase [Actinomycetes bacterium]
ERAQALQRARSSAGERSPRRTPRAYALRGIMRCGICERKMQGSWNNGKPHYRCTFLSEYAAKNKIDHPASVYLREEQLLPDLDAWLSRKFDPVAFASAVREYEASRPDEPKPDEGAQQEIAECDAKLRQLRAALEAGADPVLVTTWMKEVQARRALAEARLKTPAPRRHMTQEEITSLVTEVGGIMQALNEADPADKAEVYGRLGLTLTYHPSEKRVQAEARLVSIMYVGECPRGT